MDPNTDSLDILLSPAINVERTLGKFRPKPRPKIVKPSPEPSGLPDATQLLPPSLERPPHLPDLKCPEEKSTPPTFCINEESINQPEDSRSERLVSNGDNMVALQGDQRESGEVADMLFDMESLDFTQPPAPSERAVGRFQPKVKAQSKGKMFLTSEAISSEIQLSQEPCCLIEETVVQVGVSTVKSQFSESDASLQIDPDKSESEDTTVLSGLESSDDCIFQSSTTAEQASDMKCPEKGRSLPTIFTAGTSKMLPCTSKLNVGLEPADQLVASDCCQKEAQKLNQEKSQGVADMLSSMGSLHDDNHPALNTVEQLGKFQPKLISWPTKTKVKKVSFIPPDTAKTVASPLGSHISFPQSEDEMLACNSTGVESSFVQMLSEGSLDDTPHSSSKFSDYNGDIQMGHGKSEEDTSKLIGIESLENILSQPKSPTGRFIPKPSARVKNVRPCISTENSNSMPTDLAREQAGHVDNSILDAAPPGSIDIQSGRDNCCVGKAKSSSGSKDITEEVQSHDDELTQQILDDRSTSKTVEDDGARKSSMKLRKRNKTGSPSGEDKTSRDWDFDSNISQNAEEVPKQKRERRKSKRLTTENEKPVRKCKKASEVPSSEVQEPVKKKFPHGTQRKRRQVNKELLETPEEEIDPRQLCLKDLIMLAEHKERISNKEVAALRKSSPNESSSSLPNGAHFGTNNPSGDEHYLNSDADEANRKVEISSTSSNYHSFMNKRSTKWSKSEIELFYQAIRQFGTDFAMIQKLFPQRTRQQMKLKFKNEERKHPNEVTDALIHRSKDHSHFELVIQKLLEEAGQNVYVEPPDDPAAASVDAVNKEEEEKGCPEGADGWEGGAQSPTESNDWKGEVQSPRKFEEYEDGFEWDANASSPQDMEKDTYNDF